jgi:hypothetical protein
VSFRETILTELRNRADENLGDLFEFRILESTMELEGPPNGGARFSVEAMVDGRIFARFHLDVGMGDDLVEPLEILIGEDWLGFAELHSKGIPALSSDQQFAEKLHAYTLPRKDRTNSRVKDLIDMILLIRSGKLKTEKLIESLEKTFERRSTHDLPKGLAPPPKDWDKPFMKLANDCELLIDVKGAYIELVKLYESLKP